jgi:ribosomal protein S18 acetylase RimI-like enzyme
VKESGVVAKRSLSETDVAQIAALEAACNQAEKIRLKFNWSMMRERPGDYASDFFFYEDGRLVGYAPLDGFGGVFEVTAAVLPAFRRRGIFRALFAAARQEAQLRRATGLLLVSYPASPSGSAMVQRLRLPYKSSEYRMEATVDMIPPLLPHDLTLERVDASNVGVLAQFLTISFGDAEWNVPATLLREVERPDKRYFLAKWDDRAIGQIGVIMEAENVYIMAVGIAPEWRNRGFGRRLLATIVRRMLAEGYTKFALDVATDNPAALTLYQSCGFHQTTAYDYYTVPL